MRYRSSDRIEVALYCSFVSRLVVYCADVGKNPERFGWARAVVSWHGGRPSFDDSVARHQAIDDLVRNLQKDLGAGRPIALGFECPLFIPVLRQDLGAFTMGRPTEPKAWSAGPGAAALATGLAELIHVLDAIRQDRVPAFVEWGKFSEVRQGLFIWEAYVTGKAHSQKASLGAHYNDAKAAVEEFARRLPEMPSSIRMDQDPYAGKTHSLVGSALLRTRWVDDLGVLEQPCVVVRP